ncbi:hypothetical protein NPIL_61381 [Nephila pilipes]|uniref:Uncharacterized protein n=1 Tax=Nephila pilipes TaxID=299642 RepID=A0A8X6NM34_NEPPI|nr:hypothetical protein NPIL_61381 [Nephila pilipes]
MRRLGEDLTKAKEVVVETFAENFGYFVLCTTRTQLTFEEIKERQCPDVKANDAHGRMLYAPDVDPPPSPVTVGLILEDDDCAQMQDWFDGSK